MIIGIQEDLSGFSKKWIDYCKINTIKYKLINPYSSDIIQDLYDVDIFLWSIHHLKKKDYIAAKRLITAVNISGKKCFPTIDEVWHYDDKIGQKYLMELIEAPLIPSYVFYEKKKALEWASQTTWPKVFKLSKGAGSSNVRLIKTEKEGRKIIEKSFNKGFKVFDQRKYSLRETISKFKKTKSFINFLKGFIYLLKPVNKEWIDHIEKDYVYFQDFIPANKFDSRIIVINQKKVFGYKRFNRPDDFRASGSGNFEFYTPENIDLNLLKIGLKTAQQLNMNSVAFDFIYKDNSPVIIEFSYLYGTKGANKAPGYWDTNLKWHEKDLSNFQNWILENLIKEIKKT